MPATKNISLIVLLVAILGTGCKKERASKPTTTTTTTPTTPTPPAELRYTKDIAGSYHWTGTADVRTMSPTIHTWVDSTWSVTYDFSIEYIDDTTLLETLDGMRLGYKSSNDSVLVFYTRNTLEYDDTEKYRAINYNYQTHHLTFTRGFDNGPGWSISTNLTATK